MSFGDNYKSYLVERQDAKVLDRPEGFIIYRILDKECFIVDMFILKNHRNTEVLSDLFSDLQILAKGCDTITGNIHLSDKGCNRTINAAFKLGFKVIQANNNCLLIAKELK